MLLGRLLAPRSLSRARYIAISGLSVDLFLAAGPGSGDALTSAAGVCRDAGFVLLAAVSVVTATTLLYRCGGTSLESQLSRGSFPVVAFWSM